MRASPLQAKTQGTFSAISLLDPRWDFDGTVVLPVGALPGVVSRPAKPGEIITLYGIGFGPVIADTPVGTVAEQQNTLRMPLQILFDQSPATLS